MPAVARRSLTQNPTVFLHGTGTLLRLTPAGEVVAPVADRLVHVHQFVAQMAIQFASHFTSRELANCDVEDLIQEAVAELLLKDRFWRPERGRYITFAGTVVFNLFCNLRERASTVHRPRNASSKVRELSEMADGPARDRRIAELVRAVVGGEALEVARDEIAARVDARVDDGRRAALERAVGVMSGADIVAARRKAGLLS